MNRLKLWKMKDFEDNWKKQTSIADTQGKFSIVSNHHLIGIVYVLLIVETAPKTGNKLQWNNKTLYKSTWNLKNTQNWTCVFFRFYSDLHKVLLFHYALLMLMVLVCTG